MPALPAEITVIAIRAPGGPEMLVPEPRPLPQPAEGEVLVKVAAAGVNRPDVAQRQGNYPPPKGATDIPGLEIAGEVVALGPGVRRWKLGDKVMALVVGGGYAEYCPAHESHCLPVPAGLSMVEAAAIPETFFTVWHNTFERGRLVAGETLLVHGGSSGIGLAIARMLRDEGYALTLAARSLDKLEAAAAGLGAADRSIIRSTARRSTAPLFDRSGCPRRLGRSTALISAWCVAAPVDRPAGAAGDDRDRPRGCAACRSGGSRR